MTSIPAEDDTAIAASQPADLESTHHRVNGVRLHAVTAGKDTDPLVVLLHGFPEFWYAWHRQIEPLVEAGYRVLVPDGRGYNRRRSRSRSESTDEKHSLETFSN